MNNYVIIQLLQELPFSVIRGSVVVSPDGKYAIIVPGIAKESAEKQKNVYLLNIKTLKIEGIDTRISKLYENNL